MEVDDEGDGDANEEGITWREFALLLDMERSLDGLSSYRETKDKCRYHASHSFSSAIQLCFVLYT